MIVAASRFELEEVLAEGTVISLVHSAHRRCLDEVRKNHKNLYHGVVLDVGGRDRGSFRKPKDLVKRWITYDVQARYNPDIIGDVADMREVGNGSIDVVSAIELFEHVSRPEAGIRECARVLAVGGRLLISAPFLYPVHGDPHDYQRWTEDKWRETLKEAGFKVEKIIVLGRIFTLVSDVIRDLVVGRSRLFMVFGLPFLVGGQLLERLDGTRLVLRNSRLSRYHGGYFIVARKTSK